MAAPGSERMAHSLPGSSNNFNSNEPPPGPTRQRGSQGVPFDPMALLHAENEAPNHESQGVMGEIAGAIISYMPPEIFAPNFGGPRRLYKRG